jgi:hypothetical protein
MKKATLIVLIFSILYSCSNTPEKVDKKMYQQSRENISANETRSPLEFLTISGNQHKNIFGKTITRSVIKNSATICAYKDIRIKMLSYNAAGNMLEEHEDVFSDLLKPGDEAVLKTKYKLPKGVDSIALSIISATPVTDTLRK